MPRPNDRSAASDSRFGIFFAPAEGTNLGGPGKRPRTGELATFVAQHKRTEIDRCGVPQDAAQDPVLRAGQATGHDAAAHTRVMALSASLARPGRSQ